MHLKLFVLSASSVVLWLTPLAVLDKKLDIHKALQGVSLCAAISCAVSAGNIARKLAQEGEIELIKERAIKADIVDEISTSAYISQTQRQQEAEAILVPPTADTEEAWKRLEAIYNSESEKEEVTLATTADTSLELAKALYEEVKDAREAGKANTWIIENILKMKGRKFAVGKVRLVELQKKFGEV